MLSVKGDSRFKLFYFIYHSSTTNVFVIMGVKHILPVVEKTRTLYFFQSTLSGRAQRLARTLALFAGQ